MADVNIDYQKIHAEIAELIVETFALWDEDRVGFRWKHYLPNHTQRVRAACLEIGRQTGANLMELSFAATLHDITKSYDGEIFTDKDGNRILDENGFWKNEVLMPARGNMVTELYDRNKLYGSMHHTSGAFIARKLLKGYGLEQGFIDNICTIITAHVKPLQMSPEEYDSIYSKVESQIIYDADTMDANLGYVAFFRNIHIHAPRHMQNGGFNMAKYISSIEPWINRKQSFADILFTQHAREMGSKRQQRKRQLYQQLIAEQRNSELSMKYGILGAIDYIAGQTAQPNFRRELAALQQKWIPERKISINNSSNAAERELAERSLEQVIDFCNILAEEAEGKK